jgi:poly(3-hydroxybutyrate) depolymerase
VARRNGRTGDGQPVIYHLRELNRLFFGPATMMAHAGARLFSSPGSWFAGLPGSAGLAAAYELAYRIGKDYEKPEFGIEAVEVDEHRVAVIKQTVATKPFCRLQRFKRFSDQAEVVAKMKDQPTVLVVAPLSGHHATLLRDTVRTLLGGHKVYITDWIDAREVPLDRGGFSLADYVSYVREFIRHIGAEKLHVIAVCQATVPILAAVSLMASAGEAQPRSLTLIGGPVDARRNPTAVNQLALTKPLHWFDSHMVHDVPVTYPGRGRRVYPGFLQHASFIAMNLDRHMSSHWDFYQHVARGQSDHAEAHRRFYDEYNAVLDLPAEYYLDCIRIVFQQHLLARGKWEIAGQRVAPETITDSALLTIEGQLDDISGLGQTEAAHDLCAGVPAKRKQRLMVEGSGHYGIFSGRRWRETVYPRLREFIAAADVSGV